MRKVSAVLLALTLTAAMTAPVMAIGVFGQWQDTKDADSGYGLGIKNEFSIVPIFSVEARASWLRFSDEQWEDDLDLFPLEVFGRAKLGLFYGGLGAGYYIISGADWLKNSLGGFGAVGIELGLGGLNVFGELRYLYLEPEYDGSDGNADMSGIGAGAGLNLPF